MSRRQGKISAASERPTTNVGRSLSSESVSSEDYQRLLAHFSNDERRAEQEFMEFRDRLIGLFNWRQCQNPELQADEAFARAARSKDLNDVRDIRKFVHEFARLVALERGRSQRREPVQIGDLERLASIEALTGTAGAEDRKVREIKFQCLDSCLSKLPRRDRKLLLDYYREEKTEKLKLRKLLAETLGIGTGTLSTRLNRLRAKIAPCCKDCFQKSLEQMKQF
jgi:DNA-directed RNA polymerase specialized sigma24 family protein